MCEPCLSLFPWLNVFRYCMRWGLLPPTRKIRDCPWKKLYIQVPPYLHIFAFLFSFGSFIVLFYVSIDRLVIGGWEIWWYWSKYMLNYGCQSHFIIILFKTELELFKLIPCFLNLSESYHLSHNMQRDEEDMIELVRSCQNEFKEYYIQMQAAKRSQAPHPSQVIEKPLESWTVYLYIENSDLSSNLKIWHAYLFLLLDS